MQIRLLINFVHAGIKDQPRYHENIQFWVKINCISHSNGCSFSVDMWETNPQQTNLTSFLSNIRYTGILCEMMAKVF